MQHKVEIIHNGEHMGHCHNQYHAIHSCPDDGIIIISDGDDWLAHNDVLALLNDVYQDDVWITYGRFRCAQGRVGFCSRLSDEVIATNTVREFPRWITSHMRTFYAGLYKKIKKEHLMYEGSFWPTAVDLACIFPMLEMAGWHSRFIKDVIYVYNDMNSLSFHCTNAALQRKMASAIRKYPKYEPLTMPPYL